MKVGSTIVRAICIVGGVWALSEMRNAEAMMSSDINAAKDLARNQCASCHVIPEISLKGSEDAPSFRLLANQQQTGNWETLAATLKTPHWPNNGSRLSGTDIDNLIGYILGFTEK